METIRFCVSSDGIGILNFVNSGLADIKLKVANMFGNDSIIKQKLVTVLAANTNSANISLMQGFETGIFPDNEWIASIPQFGSAFLHNTLTAASGSNCVWVNNYFDNPNMPVSFYSAPFNLENVFSAQLNFKYVYAQQNNTNNDKLAIYITTNCGSSWIQIYSASGSVLNTTGTLVTSALLSPTPSQWKSELLDLVSFSGNKKVYFKFEFSPDINGPGNNLFIDDINISKIVGIKESKNNLFEINVFPNPFNHEITIENSGVDEINSIKVFDVIGQLQSDIKPNVSMKKIVLHNLNVLNTGIYFLEIKTELAIKIVKLIKE